MPQLDAPARRALRFMRNVSGCAGELLLWAMGRRERMRVAGQSMRPTMEAGDHLFFRRLGESWAPVGSVVVLRHEASPCGFLVKRVRAHRERGLWVASDGVGVGSERLGLIAVHDVVGLVTSRVGARGFQRVSEPYVSCCNG